MAHATNNNDVVSFDNIMNPVKHRLTTIVWGDVNHINSVSRILQNGNLNEHTVCGLNYVFVDRMTIDRCSSINNTKQLINKIKFCQKLTNNGA